jgi:hypothetical protein
MELKIYLKIVNKILLLSGKDIPFVGAQTAIHQPRLWEIGLIGGEEKFLYGSQFLLFDKNTFLDPDKSGLEDKSNFYIFMAIMNNSESSIHKQGARDLLTLLFPQHTILFNKDKILLQQGDYSSEICEENFDEFQNIIREMFFSDSDQEKTDYDPADKLASKIADKIKKGKNKAAKAKSQNKDDDIEYYTQYASILAVGLKKDINELMNYTVYQIKSEFKRFQAKSASDFYLKAKLAGAQDLEEVKGWMSEIHP